MTRSALTSYPPEHHISHDLRAVVERREDETFITLPIVPEILDGAGRPRAGVIATLADMAGGETAIRAVLPGWVATSNLSLQLGDLPDSGLLRAHPRLLRRGRTTVVLEIDLDAPETGTPIGLATLGFAVLPERSDMQARVGWVEEPEHRTQFGREGDAFDAPILEAAGVEFDPDDDARASLAVDPYLHNTLGAIQGGMVCLFMEAAAERFGARRLGGGPVRVRSLEVHYLKLCRVGPIRAQVREIGRSAAGLIARVELYDEGQDDVLASVGSVSIEPATPLGDESHP